MNTCEAVGHGARRPEDAAVRAKGEVWLPDQGGACAMIDGTGALVRSGEAGGAPNGINVALEGRVVIAMDYDERHLFVCETTSCDVLRYRIEDEAAWERLSSTAPPWDSTFPPCRMSARSRSSGAAGSDSPTDAATGCGFHVEGTGRSRSSRQASADAAPRRERTSA